jgi:hypothetical protein
VSISVATRRRARAAAPAAERRAAAPDLPSGARSWLRARQSPKARAPANTSIKSGLPRTITPPVRTE